MSVLIDILAAGAIDASGDPLANGSAYIYQVGTTQKASIFSDAALTQPASNPVTLDAAGRAEIYTASIVRIVLEDSVGTQVDDIESAGSSAGITSTETINSGQIIPIGSIIPFYDFNGSLTFDSAYWVYCDGSITTVGGESRTLPDLSNRYLVGFGTEGGGDIDTATWSSSPVGEASHQVDLSHIHVVPGHKHQIPVDDFGAGGPGVDESGTLKAGGDVFTSAQGGAVEGGSDFDSGSSLSSTQTIQPRSIRVRYIMRKA